MPGMEELLGRPAVSVFLGTLPLLGAIVWGLLQNDRALKALDKRMGGMESRLNRIETRLDGIEYKLADVSESLVRVETRLEGGRVVLVP